MIKPRSHDNEHCWILGMLHGYNKKHMLLLWSFVELQFIACQTTNTSNTTEAPSHQTRQDLFTMLPKWSHNNRKKCLPNYPDAQLATENEAYWEKMRPRDWDDMDLYDYDHPSKNSSFVLEFKPKSGLRKLFSDARGSHWQAMMRIRAKNVPRLMRDGFFQVSPRYCEGSSALRLDDDLWPKRLD